MRLVSLLLYMRILEDDSLVYFSNGYLYKWNLNEDKKYYVKLLDEDKGLLFLYRDGNGDLHFALEGTQKIYKMSANLSRVLTVRSMMFDSDKDIRYKNGNVYVRISDSKVIGFRDMRNVSGMKLLENIKSSDGVVVQFAVGDGVIGYVNERKQLDIDGEELGDGVVCMKYYDGSFYVNRGMGSIEVYTCKKEGKVMSKRKLMFPGYDHR